MQFRINTHIETPGKWFLRRFFSLFAQVKIIFNGISQCRFQLVNGAPLKSNDISNVQHIAVKNIGVRIVFKTTLIAFIDGMLMVLSLSP